MCLSTSSAPSIIINSVITEVSNVNYNLKGKSNFIGDIHYYYDPFKFHVSVKYYVVAFTDFIYALLIFDHLFLCNLGCRVLVNIFCAIYLLLT